MVYKVDYEAAEKHNCSTKIEIDDRVFYVKLFTLSENSAKFFSAEQDGNLQKEISKAEFELWLNILAEDEIEVKDILKKLSMGKKY